MKKLLMIKFARKFEEFLAYCRFGTMFFIGNKEVDDDLFFVEFFERYEKNEDEFNSLIEFLGAEPLGLSPLEQYTVGDFHVFKKGA